MVSKEAVLNCFRDWIDRYGYEHTADEDTTYQLIEALDAVRCCDEDCISRQVVIEAINDIESEVADGFGFQYEKWREYFCELPAVQPDHVADVSKKVGWIPCSERLPEKMGYYLTSNEYKVVHEDYYWGNGCFEKAKKYQCEVVAWMPMPIQPYYGGNGE